MSKGRMDALSGGRSEGRVEIVCTVHIIGMKCL